MKQFGRALAELNIEIICANSSQAKGHVEAVNRTLQDRLVKELRPAGACDMESGNEFLARVPGASTNARRCERAKPDGVGACAEAQKIGWGERGRFRKPSRDDPVAHLGHDWRLRCGGFLTRVGYTEYLAIFLSPYSCASAQPRCQAALLVSSFGLPARPASTPRSWSSISSSDSSWAPNGTLSSIRSSSNSLEGFLFALSIANFFYLVAIVRSRCRVSTVVR
jgi:hypothetical protein